MILFNEEYDLEKKKSLIKEHNQRYYNAVYIDIPDYVISKIFFLTNTININNKGVDNVTMYSISELTEEFLKDKIIFFNKLTLEPFNYHINNDPVVLHGNIYNRSQYMDLPIYQKYLVEKRELYIKDCL